MCEDARNKCDGCNKPNGTSECHSCPYQSEVHHQFSEHICNCCDNCIKECRDKLYQKTN